MEHRALARVVRILLLACLLSVALWPKSGRAQQSPPAAQPTFGIREQAPPGWDPAYWGQLRKQCIDLFAYMAQGDKMTPEQRARMPPSPFRPDLSELCLHLSPGAPTDAPGAPAIKRQPIPKASALPTPVPPQSSGSSQTLSAQLVLSSLIEPPGPFGSFEGGAPGDACQNGQPPDETTVHDKWHTENDE